MRKVVLDWSRYTVLQKIQKTRYVIGKMTTNVAVFPTPDPTLPILGTAADALEEAEELSNLGGTDRTTIRNARLDELEVHMANEVLYVQSVTQGDVEQTELAGLRTKKVSENWPVPEKVENLRARPGAYEGSVYLICNGVRYRHRYTIEMWDETVAPTPPVPDPPAGPEEPPKPSTGQWKTIYVGGKRSYTHHGLERGKVYRFRMYASNAAGNGPTSDEAVSAAG